MVMTDMTPSCGTALPVGRVRVPAYTQVQLQGTRVPAALQLVDGFAPALPPPRGAPV